MQPKLVPLKNFLKNVVNCVFNSDKKVPVVQIQNIHQTLHLNRCQIYKKVPVVDKCYFFGNIQNQKLTKNYGGFKISQI